MTIQLTQDEVDYLAFVIKGDIETIENSHELDWLVEKVHGQNILEKLQALDIAHKPID